MSSSKVRLLLLIGLIAAFVGGRDYSPTRTVQAQGPTFCFAVSDGGDSLWRVDFVSDTSTRVGPQGGSFNDIEDLTLNIDGTVLYAVHDDNANGTFGTISLSTGAFTAVGSVGPGSGRNPTTGQPATAALAGVDAITVHPWTGQIWAIDKAPRANKIFRINPATGHVIPDTFGPGLDYATIVLPNPPTDVDALTVHPQSGRFILETNGGTNDRLFELAINGINPLASPGLNSTLGTISSSLIAPLVNTSNGSNILAMEGISFFNDGTLYGVTGDQSEAGANSDRLWLINPQTGQASSVLPGEIDNDGVAPHDLDYEGVSCLSAGSNLKSGFVFEDFNGNGVFDGSDVRRSGVAISFYRDNGNGSFDGGDTRVQTKVTNANGQYTFEVGTEGLYFAVLDQATLPVGSTLTTVGSFNVNFVNFDNSLTNNNFGFTTTIVETETPTPTPTNTPTSTSTGTITPVSTPRFQDTPTAVFTPTPPPPSTPSNPSDPGIIKVAQPYSVIPGEMVTFTITVTNGNQTALTGVVVSDTLDSTFFSTVVEASATKGTVTTNGLTVTDNIGDLAPGESVVITIRARVRSDLVGPKQTTNVAILRSNERPPLSSSATVVLMTLPSTGYPPVGQSLSPGLWVVILGAALVAAAWWTRSRRRV